MSEWQKQTVPIVKFGKDHNMPELIGVFLGLKTPIETTDRQTGEIKSLYPAVFRNERGEKFQIWASAGLRMSLVNAGIEEGMTVKIVHLGKVPLAGQPGKTVNQYEIFTNGGA